MGVLGTQAHPAGSSPAVHAIGFSSRRGEDAPAAQTIEKDSMNDTSTISRRELLAAASLSYPYTNFLGSCSSYALTAGMLIAEEVSEYLQA